MDSRGRLSYIFIFRCVCKEMIVVMKSQIPLNPPLSKGDFTKQFLTLPPFSKGGLGGIRMMPPSENTFGKRYSSEGLWHQSEKLVGRDKLKKRDRGIFNPWE